MKPSLMPEKYWHELFEFGIFIKGFNGLWETVSGLMVLLVKPEIFSRWFYAIVHSELAEDPNDKIINFITYSLRNLPSQTKILAALYVLAHGLLNIFLAVQLRRNKHWAYLVAIATALIFMAYQIYRISLYHSLALTILTVFDGLFVALAVHEYRLGALGRN